MKRTMLITISLCVFSTLTLFGSVQAQIAGSTTIGVAIAELKNITEGWSAKKQVLGKTLDNEKEEKVGADRRHHYRA